jgi:hypothetical protein
MPSAGDRGLGTDGGSASA